MVDQREHGMLMKPALVLQTLAGVKTMTRRLVTPQNSTAHGWPSARSVWPRLDWSRALPGTMAPFDEPFGIWRVPLIDPLEDERDSVVLIQPRVLPGDALWIRETWRTIEVWDHIKPSEMPVLDGETFPVDYRADNPLGLWPTKERPGKTRTAIHMPRWASRLVLPVTSVRAERVQDITEEDAIAEGCTGHDPEPADEGGTIYAWPGRSSAASPLAHFRYLWDEINGHRDGASWSDNPPLWVYGWKPVR